jgi:hypothetical protein
MTMKNIIFRVVTLCSSETAQHLRGTHCLHLHRVPPGSAGFLHGLLLGPDVSVGLSPNHTVVQPTGPHSSFRTPFSSLRAVIRLCPISILLFFYAWLYLVQQVPLKCFRE